MNSAIDTFWFPEGAVFQLDVAVTETASGVTETLIDRSVKFVTSPYVIKMSRSQQYFKPGLPFDVKVS
jgi:hypothetical protein